MCPMKHVKTYGIVIHLENIKIYLLMIIFQLYGHKVGYPLSDTPTLGICSLYIQYIIYIPYNPHFLSILYGLVTKSYSDFLNLP